MIRYDNTTLATTIAAKSSQIAKRAGLVALQMRRWTRFGRLRWIVTSNIICLGDVCHLESLNVVEAGKPMKRPGPGTLGRWCKTSCKGRFRQISYDEWAFSDEEDAKLFDLFWGSGKENPDYPRFDRRNRAASA